MPVCVCVCVCVYNLILDISVVHREWVNLTIVSTWFYENPFCTDGGIMLFLLLLTKGLKSPGVKASASALNIHCTPRLWGRVWVLVQRGPDGGTSACRTRCVMCTVHATRGVVFLSVC